MNFDEYLDDLPLFHSWDGGRTWCPGGFAREHLEPLHRFLSQCLPANPVILETGAGNSTVTMLFLKPSRLISIAPDEPLFDRIEDFCVAKGIDASRWERHADGSQWVLPKMALENRASPPYLDFALIDGSHGWPTAFVDLEYTNLLLKKDGYLLIDDVQLHSCKEMARLLDSLPCYELALDLGKALVFRKTADVDYLGEWNEQPYICQRTQKYGAQINPYALKDGGLFDAAAGHIQRSLRKVGRMVQANLKTVCRRGTSRR